MSLTACILFVTLPSTSAPGAELTIPSAHPYLALAPDDITRAEGRIARIAWARQSLADLTRRADDIIAGPIDKLPDKGDTAHHGISSHLFTVAVTHAFTRKRQYAEWVRDGLVAYAELYPRLPMTNGRCKVFSQSSLYEALWFVPIVQAYDLVVESGALTDAQKRHIEEDLLRGAVKCFKVDDYEHDPRIGDLHYRCYNFQAWHVSAVGLAGLALRDRTLVDWAVDGRYGFKHLVAHDIRDDGLFWERSVGYHEFVIDALLPFTEAMMRCGVDLYRLEVPNDRSRDEGAHYVTDTSDRPKSLRMMFEAPFYLAFPDLTTIALGDSGRGPLRGNWRHLVGYHRYRDPRLAWLLRRDVPLGDGENRGRVGFLHYYRYSYRYEGIRLDGKPVSWDRRDATYERRGDAVTASDGGTRQPDRYLLNDADVANFTLDWIMTRLADSGRDDRAWVVFNVQADNPRNRKTFALTSHLPEIGRRYRLRLEVRGDRIELSREGQAVSAEPAVYRFGPDWRWLVYDAPDAAPRDLVLERSFANTGVFEDGCSLFPSSGVAVLRQAAGDPTADPESTAVALTFGPYGGGHGHPDKLSVAVYAQGRQWIPHFGSMPYETRWKSDWTAHTVSHNTLVLDGVSQRPNARGNKQWPVDSARDRVVGKLERFEPSEKLAVASCDRAYEGFLLRRAVRVVGNCVVDRFDVSPTLPDADPPSHRFDYVLHVDGSLAESSVALSPRGGLLGERCGYQLVEQRQGAAIGDVASLSFRSGSKLLRVWVVPMEGSPLELVLAEGLTNSPTEKMPMLVLRRTAPRATFVTVIEPVDEAVPLRGVRRGDDRLGLERTAGIEEVRLE